MSTFCLDYNNGNDANNGSTWALAWKTITSGATAAQIAPNDLVKVAKSPAPTIVTGNTATWNNLSKTVTLGTANTLNIDMCETAWTANPSGDTTVARTAVATDGKEGSYSMKLTLDSAVQTSIMQAYFATGTLNLSAYQKISFWLKNSAAIAASNWYVALCSDTAGTTVVDQFLIPAIPSTARWLPLTLARVGGGNLGASIQSIAIYTDTVAPTASSNIFIDDFIACLTSGLNLQSLISKNNLEQGGTEIWYGIQSINGVTVLLDNDTNTKGNAGRGYNGTTETVNTYFRETIKTALAASYSTSVQEIQDSGSLAVGNIQFQGGYNTSNDTQDGETFFDGLNGNGYGIYLIGKSYITLNRINPVRYDRSVYYNNNSNNNAITTLTANNNSNYGVYYNSSNNNTITTLTANNNSYNGVYYGTSYNNTITTLTANNNTNGVYYYNSNNNIITTITANNSSSYGVYYGNSSNNKILNLSTASNATSGIYNDYGINYIYNASIAEATEVSGMAVFANSRIFSNKHDNTANNHWIFTDGGTINSLATDRVGGTGLMWKAIISSANRASNYPLKMSLIKLAVVANKLVTITAYMKKDHATNVAAQLLCRGGQIAGVAADVTATKASDTNWEQLTITFTPTEAGAVEIEFSSWYVAANSNCYCGEVTVGQAA